MFGDVLIENNNDIGPVTRTKLATRNSKRSKNNTYLQIELVSIIDAGAPLVKSTYNLEGDGLLI